MRKALKLFGNLRKYVGEGSTGRAWNEAVAMVITGKAGVVFQGDWAKGEFTHAGMTAGTDYGCSLAPESTSLLYIADAFSFPVREDPNEKAAQKLLAEIVMSPDVQAKFSVLKGSIPVRTDIDTSSLDVCAQEGLKYMKSGDISPDLAIIAAPKVIGALGDFIDEFWNTPSMDIDEAAETFYEIFD